MSKKKHLRSHRFPHPRARCMHKVVEFSTIVTRPENIELFSTKKQTTIIVRINIILYNTVCTHMIGGKKLINSNFFESLNQVNINKYHLS